MFGKTWVYIYISTKNFIKYECYQVLPMKILHLASKLKCAVNVKIHTRCQRAGKKKQM